MIYRPGTVQLLLINASASGDGDTKLPSWPPERKFMGLVVAGTLGSGISLNTWLQVVPGLSRDGQLGPCRVPGLSGHCPAGRVLKQGTSPHLPSGLRRRDPALPAPILHPTHPRPLQPSGPLSVPSLSCLLNCPFRSSFFTSEKHLEVLPILMVCSPPPVTPESHRSPPFSPLWSQASSEWGSARAICTHTPHVCASFVAYNPEPGPHRSLKPASPCQ